MIDSVSTYCHRWCERCPFTSRCSLVAYNKEHIPKKLQDEIVPLPNSFPALSGKFSHFLGRLELCLVQYRNSLSVIGYGAGEERPRSNFIKHLTLRNRMYKLFVNFTGILLWLALNFVER